MSGACPVVDAPVWVGQLDLTRPSLLEPVSPRDPIAGELARILVRVRGDPVGFVELVIPGDELERELLAAVGRQLGEVLAGHSVLDATGYTSSTAGATGDIAGLEPGSALVGGLCVVVCTRGRPGTLAGCLKSLRSLVYQGFEVVVVDNAPADDATARLFDIMVGGDPRFRYVREPRVGLSNARNRGLVEASARYVAFTDDDVVVDSQWLSGIARGFGREPGVGCVTGLVPSARLDTPAERYFDRRVAWSSSLQPRIYDLEARRGASPLFPFDAGRLGAGANFGIERDLAVRLGGFDPALGAGSPARGGEDLDMFVRVLQAGSKLAYEPSAIVWHFHRVDMASLRSQMHGYGIGLGAYLAKQMMVSGSRSALVRGAPRGAAHMLRLWRGGDRGTASTGGMAVFEALGLVEGPVAFARGRLAQGRLAQGWLAQGRLAQGWLAQGWLAQGRLDR
jgi:GT2 family glycosyltransferase